MKLFPHKEFAIETSLSEDEVKGKLIQLFNKEKGSDYRNLFQTNKLEERYYYGFFEGEKFALFHDDPYVLAKAVGFGEATRNSEFVCEGAIEEHGEHTKILITVDAKRQARINSLLYNLANISFLLLFFYLDKRGFFGEYFIYLILTVFIILFLSDIFYFRKKYFKKVQQFLTDFFEAN